jgi:succinate dehydrogenase/fumarate reductase flavoprotein subunit
MTAAITAAELGAHVIVLEKGPEIGGSAILSGGNIWTFERFEDLRSSVPDGDPVLQRLVWSRIGADRSWLASIGVDLTPLSRVLDLGQTRAMVASSAMTTMHQRLGSLGSEVWTATRLVDLVVDGRRVVAVRVEGGRGLQEIPAAAVILATGGFQASPTLLSHYLTSSPDNLLLRSNPWSSGDALDAAVAIGAATSGGMGAFYGHAMAISANGVGDNPRFREISQVYGQMAVALNMDGRRFADESVGTGEEVLNFALAKQRQGRGFYVVDENLADKQVQAGFNAVIRDTIGRAKELGADVLVANSLEDLSDALGRRGISATVSLGSLREFNLAIENGRHLGLNPPRRRFLQPLTAAPFYAVRVQASITFTNGGLAVDPEMRVLRQPSDGSTSDPIDGLLAAGCDVGNVNHVNYLGGLSVALVTGRVAGVRAAAISLLD